jgi:hypothetical protein
MSPHVSIRSPLRRPAAAAVGALLVLTLGACSGTTSTGGSGGTDGSGGVGATDNQPVATSGLGLGGGSVAGVSVAGTSLKKSGAGIAVFATVTGVHPDRLVGMTSNYTTPATLLKPVAVSPGTPTRIDATTAVLQPNGPIDDGATVAVTFTFATAGIVQVYGTYRD